MIKKCPKKDLAFAAASQAKIAHLQIQHKNRSDKIAKAAKIVKCSGENTVTHRKINIGSDEM